MSGPLKIDWTTLKTLATNKSIPIQYSQDAISYLIFIDDASTNFITRILIETPRNSDQIDWEDNYKASANGKNFTRTALYDPVSGNQAGITSDNKLKTTAVLVPNEGVNIGSVKLADGPNIDAFGRLRVSEPKTMLDCVFRRDLLPNLFWTSTSNGGTIAHSGDTVSATLSCTTTTGSQAILQTIKYIQYHPGKSQKISISFNFKSTATAVSKKIGYYDEDDGMFIRLTGSTLSVVLRSSTSGSAVDTVVAQSSWNLDKLDGTGSSGVTLDVTKQQLLVIDFQWQGSGRIRYGFNIGGQVIYCHQMLHANVLTIPYCRSGNLPVRCEINNAGSTASSMHITCVSVMSEGGENFAGDFRSVNNGSTSRTFSGAGTTIPVLSLRKQTAYVDDIVKIEDIGVFANSADDFLISITMNGTLTNASWSNVTGKCQKDVSATAISGGTVLYSFYLRGGSGISSTVLAQIFSDAIAGILGHDASNNSEIITVVGLNITSSATLLAAINYRET